MGYTRAEKWRSAAAIVRGVYDLQQGCPSVERKERAHRRGQCGAWTIRRLKISSVKPGSTSLDENLVVTAPAQPSTSEDISFRHTQDFVAARCRTRLEPLCMH